MKKLTVGDRVRVYGCDGQGINLTNKIGTLQRRAECALDKVWWVVKIHAHATENHVHAQQCRRLVKKERRRVWVKYKNGVPCREHHACESKDDLPDGIEFIEVRPKK